MIGIPVLVGGLWYAMRGSVRGRFRWLGGLAYMTYMWANVAVQITFNELFLVYVALFGLSLFTFVVAMMTTDADAIRQTLEGRLNTSLYSGALVVIGLGVVVLSIFLSAAWLFRERAWGYVFAGIELVLGATLAVPIGLMTLVLLTGDTVTVSPVAAVFTLLPIVASAVLAVAYLRSMGRRPESSEESDRGQFV